MAALSSYEMLSTVLLKFSMEIFVESFVESSVKSFVESSKVAQLLAFFTFKSMWTFAEEIVTKSTYAYSVIMAWFVEASIVF